MNTEMFSTDSSYWRITQNIKDVYQTDSSMAMLLDFERVLDEVDMYAFKNWILGELVEGPNVSRYAVACVFMYPESLMPDPRAIKRLMQYDCTVNITKSKLKVPVKVEDYDDFVPGTKKPKLEEKPIWLIEIVIPKTLLSDIKEGVVEIEGRTIDLEEIDNAYSEGFDETSATQMDDDMNDEIDLQQNGELF